jgi:hypothetical protein
MRSSCPGWTPSTARSAPRRLSSPARACLHPDRHLRDLKPSCGGRHEPTWGTASPAEALVMLLRYEGLGIRGRLALSPVNATRW